ncbi:MAG: hypothetical protein IJM17_03135 [Firmicutes bacterium]|nr:hypothetical protein [Bacillota bacterium]
MSESVMKLVGGSPKRFPLDRYYISSAQASDTRLMGVVALKLCFVLDADEEELDKLREEGAHFVRVFRQVYCFELEDGGLDRAVEIEGEDGRARIKMRKAWHNVFGGLGGKEAELDPEEALWVIAKYTGDISAFRSELQPGIREVIDLALRTEEESPMKEAGIRVLNEKLCVPICTDYGRINYFLMRCVSHDLDGAALLVDDGADKSRVDFHRIREQASLIRNEIEPVEREDDLYLCESVIDTETASYIMISEIRTGADGIIGAERKKVMKLSEWESRLKLSRPEFLTFYSLKDGEDCEQAVDYLSDLLPRASCKRYDDGVLFMDYYTNNSHVERPVFNIGDDLMASYYITADGQLLAASFSEQGISAAERRIALNGMTAMLDMVGRYSFTEPVLGPFIESGFSDFEEYLELITQGEQS